MGDNGFRRFDAEAVARRSPRLIDRRKASFAESARPEAEIRANLRGLPNGS